MKKTRFALIVVVVIFMIFISSAIAVTYRNDGPGAVILRDKHGNQMLLHPGQTLETYFYSSDTSLTKISDLPYYNRVLDRDHVTATLIGVDVAIDLMTDTIVIEKITGAIDVYVQSTSNLPAEYYDRTADDIIIQIPAKGRFDNIVVTGTGTCDVVQYQD